MILLGETACLAGRKNFIYTAVGLAVAILIILISSRCCSLKRCNILLLFCCLAGGIGLGMISLGTRTESEELLGERLSVTGWIVDAEVKDDTLIFVVKAGGRQMRLHVPKEMMEAAGGRPGAFEDPQTESGRLAASEEPQTESEKRVYVGCEIKAEGILVMPEGSTNPGSYDSYAYYSGNDIAGNIYAERAELTGRKRKVSYALACLRKKMAEQLYIYFPEKQAAFLAGLILGEKSGMDRETKLLYMKNGLAHILAISGMHIAIIAGAVERLLMLLGMGRKKRGIAVILMVLLYGVMTGLAASTIRAIVMLSMKHIGVLIGRTSDVPTDMMTAILIISIMNPWSVFTVGPQLSFVAALSMYISNEIFICFFGWKKCFLRRKKTDGKLLRDEHPRKLLKRDSREIVLLSERLRRMLNNECLEKIIDKDKRKKIAHKIARTLISTLVINLLVTPVLIYHYYEIYPYGMLLGIIILPTVSFVIAGGFIVILLGFLCCYITGAVPLNAAKAAAWLTGKVLAFYEELCRVGLRLPGSSINPGHAGVISVILSIGIILIVMWWLLHRGKQRQGRAALLTAGVICVMSASVFLLLTGYLNRRKERVIYLDVGQGLSVVIHIPDKGNYLVDGGSTSKTDVGEYAIIPALKYYGMSDVRAVFVSHTDMDHISGIIELGELAQLYRIRIETVCMAVADEEDENYMLLKEAMTDSTFVTGLSSGDVIDGCFTVIYPFTSENRSTMSAEGSTENGSTMSAEDSTENGSTMSAEDSTENGSRHEADSDAMGSDHDRNDSCLVIKGCDTLFPGDISSETEQLIVHESEAGRIPDIRAGTLVVSHHGSRYSSDLEFLRTVGADTAVISCGRNNSYGHPAPETLERLEKCGIRTYRTDKEGAIIIEY